MRRPKRSKSLVTSVFEGVVQRRSRDGHVYEARGYAEILSCGHRFVPYDNHRFGGQDEPHRAGEFRYCDLCPEGA